MPSFSKNKKISKELENFKKNVHFSKNRHFREIWWKIKKFKFVSISFSKVWREGGL